MLELLFEDSTVVKTNLIPAGFFFFFSFQINGEEKY